MSARKLQIRNSTAEFLIFIRQAGEDGIEVRVQDETVWLTQKLLAVLFDATMAIVGGAATFCWPEVWVEDEDFARASAIVAKERPAAQEPAEPWQCSRCGETVNGELAECWKCGAAADARDEEETPGGQPPASTTPQPTDS